MKTGEGLAQRLLISRMFVSEERRVKAKKANVNYIFSKSPVGLST